MNKKAVIEMMESFMILLVVFILIGFGMYFFFKVSVASTQESAEEMCMLDASQMLSSVLSVPEIQCSVQGALEDDCIDTVKLIAFMDSDRKKLLEGKGACLKKIEFVQVYPVPEGRKNDTECTAPEMRNPDFPENCGKWTLVGPENTKGMAARKISTPISLYYPHIREFGLGKLMLTTYTKV